MATYNFTQDNLSITVNGATLNNSFNYSVDFGDDYTSGVITRQEDKNKWNVRSNDLPDIKFIDGTNTFKLIFETNKEVILTENAVKQLIENIKLNDLSYDTVGSWIDNDLTFTIIPKDGKNEENSNKKLTFTIPSEYGDIKNPYGDKTTNYVLAGPASGNAKKAPTFRKLVEADIPNLTKSKISDFPTKVSAFTNDSGYLTSFTERDPTVPAWAKTASKPSYTLSEITSATNVQAIENISETSGLLKKTATNTWALDTTKYQPKKIVGVIKIGPPASSTTEISNITKYYASLSDAQNSQSNNNAIPFGADFADKTIIISPATDTDWILWRDSGIRCSNQTNISGDTGGLTFTAEDNFSTTTSTYANIIILD